MPVRGLMIEEMLARVIHEERLRLLQQRRRLREAEVSNREEPFRQVQRRPRRRPRAEPQERHAA